MSDEKRNEIFTNLEIDTIGEIMNISMGSAATAASTLLDNKVTITTPQVDVIALADFELGRLEPAIAVQIQYVEGISGANILILRKEDVRVILSQMMMTEIPPEDFVLDEMAESAICELMNQMMGSSATVLSCFLGRTINISTPNTVSVEHLESFKQQYFGHQENILTIAFDLSISGIMESQFVSVMAIDLAKEIIGVSLNFDTDTPAASAPPAQQPAPAAPAPQPAPAAYAPPPEAPAPAPVHQPPAAPAAAPPPMAPPPMAPPGYPQYPQYPPQYAYPPQPQAMYPAHEAVAGPPIRVQSYDYGDFSTPGAAAAAELPPNLELVMGVPVTVSVELGRTRRKIKEILDFGQGSIVELDKQAGSPVDIIVNGQLIARGEVVVVDDNFSVRITEILKNRDNIGSLI